MEELEFLVIAQASQETMLLRITEMELALLPSLNIQEFQGLYLLEPDPTQVHSLLAPQPTSSLVSQTQDLILMPVE